MRSILFSACLLVLGDCKVATGDIQQGAIGIAFDPAGYVIDVSVEVPSGSETIEVPIYFFLNRIPGGIYALEFAYTPPIGYSGIGYSYATPVPDSGLTGLFCPEFFGYECYTSTCYAESSLELFMISVLRITKQSVVDAYNICLGPFTPSSVSPPAPAYVACEDHSVVLELPVSEPACITLNLVATVGVGTSSWGVLKALY